MSSTALMWTNHSNKSSTALLLLDADSNSMIPNYFCATELSSKEMRACFPQPPYSNTGPQTHDNLPGTSLDTPGFKISLGAAPRCAQLLPA
jgi:hypothetical protein